MPGNYSVCVSTACLIYIADILQDIDVLIEARELAKKAFKNPQMLREIEDALSSQFDERFQRIFYS